MHEETPGAAERLPRFPFAHREIFMTVNIVMLQPLIALLAGVLILIMPRLLNYIVAVYLIIIGVAGLAAHL